MLKRISSFTSALVISLSSLFVFAPIMAHATVDVCTWTGATDLNFNTATNWSCATDGAAVPTNGDSLLFDVTSLTASKTLVNDITGLSVANITFQGTNSSYYSFTLTGNSMTLAGNITSTSAIQGTISNNLVLAGNPTVSVVQGGFVSLDGAISGTGNITKTGAGSLGLGGSNTFIGSVSVSAGTLGSDTSTAFGATANNVSVNDGATLQVGSCNDTGFTVANNITLTGASSSPTGSFITPKLGTGAMCRGGGGTVDEEYQRAGTSTQEYTLSGSITLGSDVTFGAFAIKTTISGPLSGSFKFTLPNTYGGQLVVASSGNSSAIANGTYDADAIVKTLSDSQPANTVSIGRSAIITIDGARGDTFVASGGILKGTGTVGALSIGDKGTVAPGHSPGCLNSGNLSFVAGSIYEFEVGGATACTEYDQIKVTGTVTLGNGTLNTILFNNFKPVKGQSYMIIENDAADVVAGTFLNLAEGATFTVGGYVLKISYLGGTGNDVVLTVQGVPAVPDTGFKLMLNNPILTLVSTTVLAGAMLVLAKKYKQVTNR